MNFKEQIEADLNIFFNPDEFGEDHSIDGKVVNVIVDNETLKSRNKKEYDGIVQADMLYFAKEEDLLKEPRPDGVQMFDGIPYIIFDAKLDDGVYEVILQANKN
ncbi:hypothetical protein psyc5s11_44980 [Clostridium gelidum]|uniref:Uncharacterized protein n=1 Tax=Clostridium gelidum TaxID=704125 RepID=A0ABM7TAT0_9CLOT|nr:hypothetical protein [Clostridium gelidum]BCZ48431.1 hypothetical protein psyc5s11_44980 [Clostridium gelidum]